jgi:transposase InsO family protein
MQIRRGLFQFTAVDDCSRMRVLGLYARRTAKNAVSFLEERVLEEFPFPVQRIQADRGAEFFGMAFQRALRRHKIKFRPIPPRSPHLNGKVERSQQTDRIEFYATVDLADPALEEHVDDWQHFYNFQRPHSALGGRTPVQRCCERYPETPWSWEVVAQYDASTEPIRERQYYWDQRVTKVKRSM